MTSRFRFSARLCGAMFAVVAAMAQPLSAHAASLYFSPSSASQAVGTSFSVKVLVSSTDQPMNAAIGTVSFSPDILEMTSISKGGSILNFWTAEPSFSAAKGTASFEGVVFNPGYTGGAGNIVTMVFKAKAPGKATLSFSRASVLANDGKGTEIMQQAGTASMTVTEASAAPAASVPSGLPGTPVVSSSTHPEQDKWYAGRDAVFAWRLPAGVDGVNILGDHGATTDPGTVSDGLMSSWSYKNVEDGTWYFHARFHNAVGWGPTAHFRFRVDSKPPEPFTVTVAKDDVGNSVVFQATDALSGVSSYLVSVDGGEGTAVLAADAGKPFVLAGLAAGNHVVTVKAFDAAGNVTEATADVLVEAAPEPAVETVPVEAPAVVSAPEQASGAAWSASSAVWLVLAALFAALAVILLLLALLRRRVSGKVAGRDIAVMMRAVRRSHDLLKGHIREELKALDAKRVKGKLTPEDEQVDLHLRKHLKEIEVGFDRAIRRLEKQLK